MKSTILQLTLTLIGEKHQAANTSSTHDEMKSKEQRAVDKKIEKEKMKNASVPHAEKHISSHFQCGNCKEKKVSYSQTQKTTFCECTICGDRWNFP